MEITRYDVGRVMVQALATTCTLGGLRPGCIYRWSVRACNNAGCGKPCVPLDFKTAPDVPDAPGVPTASSRTSNSLLMKWAPPLHDGGSDIHQYRLEISEGAPFGLPLWLLEQLHVRGWVSVEITIKNCTGSLAAC